MQCPSSLVPSWNPVEIWLDKYKENQAYCCDDHFLWIHTLSWRQCYIRRRSQESEARNNSAPLNWTQSPSTEKKSLFAFKTQPLQIISPQSSEDNCLLGGTNTGRNQLHISVSKDRWAPVPCTFQTSKEVFSTGSFFSSSRTGRSAFLREDSLAWESKDEWFTLLRCKCSWNVTVTCNSEPARRAL